MSPRRRKILGYFAMFLSIDVLSASILGLIFMWIAFTYLLFLRGAIISILYVWTIFVMWKFLRWANAWRKGTSPSLTPVPAAAESKPEEQRK